MSVKGRSYIVLESWIFNSLTLVDNFETMSFLGSDNARCNIKVGRHYIGIQFLTIYNLDGAFD